MGQISEGCIKQAASDEIQYQMVSKLFPIFMHRNDSKAHRCTFLNTSGILIMVPRVLPLFQARTANLPMYLLILLPMPMDNSILIPILNRILPLLLTHSNFPQALRFHPLLGLHPSDADVSSPSPLICNLGNYTFVPLINRFGHYGRLQSVS